MHRVLYLFNALDELEEWACKKNAILLNFGESFYKKKDSNLTNKMKSQRKNNATGNSSCPNRLFW